MATNRYVDTDFLAVPRGRSRHARSSGTPDVTFEALFEKAATDNDTSILRLWKEIPANFVPTSILIANDALAGATAVHCGLYESTSGDSDVNGALISKNVFADTLDLSSAHATLFGTTPLNAFKDVNIDSQGKRLFEHAGHTVITKKRSYDVALTGDTFGVALGTILVRMRGYMG